MSTDESKKSIGKNEELRTLVGTFIHRSPNDYINQFGSGALELLKSKPIPKDEILYISEKDTLLSKIFGSMENIQVNLSNEEENIIDFSLMKIAENEIANQQREERKSSKWYENFAEEFKFHKSTNIKFIRGWESDITYWAECRISNLTPFIIKIPKLYNRENSRCDYDSFFTVSKNEIGYIYQYYYIGNGIFYSLYQLFWDFLRVKEKVIINKCTNATEVEEMTIVDECFRDAMKLCSTYINPDLSNYSLWLMSRQFKIMESNDKDSNIKYLNIDGEWFDKVTGSFGNVGSKYSLKHGVNIRLKKGRFRPLDEGIIDLPYATERMTNIFPSSAGFKRINVTCIEKMELVKNSIDDDGMLRSLYQDNVPVKIKEVDYSLIPDSEEVGLTCIVIDIKDDIGSLRNNTLDMFNMNKHSMNKLMTVDEEEITKANKLILNFREKAVIGGDFGIDAITQVLCTFIVENSKAENIFKYFEKQDIVAWSTKGERGTVIEFIPDLIMNHTNRDNNVALRLLSNARYKAISENKEINITFEESNNAILKENDELLVNVKISINNELMEELTTQLLFLTGYHQPTHSGGASATQGNVNINYRQALAASEVFTPRDYAHVINNFDKATIKAKLLCAARQITDGSIEEKELSAEDQFERL